MSRSTSGQSSSYFTAAVTAFANIATTRNVHHSLQSLQLSKPGNCFLIIALQAYSAFTHCNLLMCFPISILQLSMVFFMCCLCYVLMHCERHVLRVDAFWLHLPMCNSHTAMMQRSQAAFCASCAKSPSLEHNTRNIPTSNSHLNLESSSKTRTKARERKSINQYFFNIAILHLSWSWGTPKACPVTDPLTHSASVTGTVAVHIALPKCWKPSIADHIAKYCQVSQSITKYRQVLPSIAKYCIASGAWWCHADLQIAWRGLEKNPLASSASALYTGFTEQGILGMDVFGTGGLGWGMRGRRSQAGAPSAPAGRPLQGFSPCSQLLLQEFLLKPRSRGRRGLNISMRRQRVNRTSALVIRFCPLWGTTDVLCPKTQAKNRTKIWESPVEPQRCLTNR